MTKDQKASAMTDELRRGIESLTYWKHCMSYNDSYFGEPAGLIKRIAYQLDRLLATTTATSVQAVRNAALEEAARHFEGPEFDQLAVSFIASEIRALATPAQQKPEQRDVRNSAGELIGIARKSCAPAQQTEAPKDGSKLIYHYHAFYQEGETTTHIDGILNCKQAIDNMDRYSEAKQAICAEHANKLVIDSLSVLEKA